MDLRELSMILSVLCFVYSNAVAAPVSGQQANLDGKFLFDYGTNVSNPLLRLIGRAFQRYDDKSKATKQELAEEIKAAEKRLTDTICDSHPCTEWENWSSCSVQIKGQFGSRSRSRDCSNSKKLCSSIDTSNLPIVETGMCEGWQCPGTYSNTSGYCLKLYNTQMMAQWDAQAACQQDGGHLVNVNTQAKSDAMHAILNSHGITSQELWINGNRTQKAGAWLFTYGAVPDFDNWNSGEPSNGSSELCKVEQSSPRVWYDNVINSTISSVRWHNRCSDHMSYYMFCLFGSI